MKDLLDFPAAISDFLQNAEAWRFLVVIGVLIFFIFWKYRKKNQE